MNNTIYKKLMIGAAVIAPFSSFSGNTLYNENDTGGITIDAQIRLEVGKDTNEIYIQRDDTTADLVTRAFVLKHADPYELRPYVRNMVQAAEFVGNEDNSHVECAKYEDGRGVLIVTAEGQKFTEKHEGLTIQDFINQFDKQGITSSSGSKRFLYLPKHESAEALSEVLHEVVLQTSASSDEARKAELLYTKEKTAIDYGLNALVVYCNPHNVELAKRTLESIDNPHGGNSHLKCTVYQIDKQNDADLGNDFQAWKNVNYYGTSVKGKDITIATGIDSQFVSFLQEKGLAKIFVQGEMVIACGKVGIIGKTTGTIVSRDIVETANTTTTTSTTYDPTSVSQTWTDADADGVVDSGELTAGTSITASTSSSISPIDKDINELNDANFRAADKTEKVGFYLRMAPKAIGKTVTVDIDIQNTSIIGYNQNGSAKVESMPFSTDVTIRSNSDKYVIGGMTRKEIITNVEKVPFLGSIPGLGWLFSSENTETKTSQLVIVIETKKAFENWGTRSAEATIATADKATAEAGEKSMYGTGQYIFDEDMDFDKDVEKSLK